VPQLIPSLLLALLGALPPQAGPDGESVSAVLAAHPTGASRGAATRALVGLGSGAVPALFEVLWRGQAPPAVERLRPDQLAAVEEALRSWPSEVLSEFFWTLTRPEVPDEPRELALRLLGDVGRSGHLLLLGRLASPRGDEDKLARGVTRAFEGSFVRLLRREPLGVDLAPGVYSDGGFGLATCVLRGLGELRTGPAVELLGSLYGRRPALDVFLLTQLRAGAAEGRLYDTDELCGRLTRDLRAREVPRAAAAATTLGVLGDDRAVGELIALLEHEALEVRLAARGALTHITGFGFGDDDARWRRWFAGEEAWWHDRGDVVIDRLERSHGRSFTRAVVEALERRTQRGRLARSLAGRLEDRETDLVVTTCRALTQMDSLEAVPALIATLDSEHGEVRAAVHAALRALLRRDQPPPGGWADLLP